MINFSFNNSENSIEPTFSEEESKELTLPNEENKDNNEEYYNALKLEEEKEKFKDGDVRTFKDCKQIYMNGKWNNTNLLINDSVKNIFDENIQILSKTEENSSKDAAKYDKGKLQITLIPTEIIRAITEVRMFGAKKYKPANWIEISKRRYKDALLRHILEYIDNEDAVDSESGLPALWHAACNIAFLIDMHRKDWDKRKEQITKNFADMEENK